MFQSRLPQNAEAAATGTQYGINVEPSYRPWRWAVGPNPDSWWDPATGRAKVDSEMPLIAQLGVTYLRLEFPWTFLETTHGVYDWTRADYVVNSANHYGVQIEPVVVFCPSWEGAPVCVPNAGDYGSFIGALVGRYHGSIHYWEMWNESSLSRYFPGSVLQYVQNVLNPGYNAAKAADPTARVLVSGQPFTNQSFVDGLFAAGAKFDIAAYHDYSSSASSANSSATTIQGWFAAHGFNGPLWLGEFGLQENSLSDGNQQAYFTGVIQSSNPSAVIMWYNLRDDDIYTGPATVDHSEHYGLAQHNLALKQGFCAYRALVARGVCPGPSPSPSPSSSPSSSPGPSASSAPSSSAVPRASPPAQPNQTPGQSPGTAGTPGSRPGPTTDLNSPTSGSVRMPMSPQGIDAKRFGPSTWPVWAGTLSAVTAASLLALTVMGVGLLLRRRSSQAKTAMPVAREQSHHEPEEPPPADGS